jgi:hypothetical protein
MGATAIGPRCTYRIPLLVVVCNNRSFFNDELHQERVARIRNRPVENRWIGQRISIRTSIALRWVKRRAPSGSTPLSTRAI